MHFSAVTDCPEVRRQLAIQMKSKCGFVKPDSAENELAKLPFEAGGIAVGKTGHGGKPRQAPPLARCDGRTRTGERRVAIGEAIAYRDRAFERCG